ncbi:hypothetical protein THRCLA_20352 [Thraustotheca clavata]|uniref:Ankyrin repeat n=1 Tax=Thraustotheca clavata TaxID=74557 RepID=A0A1W0A8B4_9STRA|nr:hypothetical protein THRCLA_20352 [Thraustotheca clavata]
MHLHGKYYENYPHDSIDAAAYHSHLHIVKFLHENKIDAVNLAAVEGYLDIVKFLLGNQTEGCKHQAMDNSATLGHLGIVISS